MTQTTDLDRLAAAHAAAMLIIDGWDDTPESVAARTIFNAMPTLIAELRQLRVERDRLREALAIYAESCDATETTPCGYQGSLCCMTARAALGGEHE